MSLASVIGIYLYMDLCTSHDHALFEGDLFHLELLIVQLVFEGVKYMRATSNLKKYSKWSLPLINSMPNWNFLVTSVLYGYQHNFGQGTGPVFLYGVRCTGTESSLLSCSHSGISYNWCSHSSDAGVVCPCRLDVYLCLLNA